MLKTENNLYPFKIKGLIRYMIRLYKNFHDTCNFFATIYKIGKIWKN